MTFHYWGLCLIELLGTKTMLSIIFLAWKFYLTSNFVTFCTRGSFPPLFFLIYWCVALLRIRETKKNGIQRRICLSLTRHRRVQIIWLVTLYHDVFSRNHFSDNRYFNDLLSEWISPDLSFGLKTSSSHTVLALSSLQCTIARSRSRISWLSEGKYNHVSCTCSSPERGKFLSVSLQLMMG